MGDPSDAIPVVKTPRWTGDRLLRGGLPLSKSVTSGLVPPFENRERWGTPRWKTGDPSQSYTFTRKGGPPAHYNR
jgi:hypothetical protein